MLSPEEMDKIVNVHAAAEYALDLDATMATVAPDPLWEFHPLGLRVATLDRVREMYALQFEHLFQYIESGRTRAVAYGENVMVSEKIAHLRLEDGRKTDAYYTVVFTFSEGLVASERAYLSGGLHGFIERAYSGPFSSRPGVSRLY